MLQIWQIKDCLLVILTHGTLDIIPMASLLRQKLMIQLVLEVNLIVVFDV